VKVNVVRAAAGGMPAGTTDYGAFEKRKKIVV
jgi:hypothetical protein